MPTGLNSWIRCGFCILWFSTLTLQAAGADNTSGQIKLGTDNQAHTSNNLGNAQPSYTAVGDYGDLDRLVIRGTETFEPEVIKKALNNSLLFRVAATPSADLFDYIDELKKSIQAGYRQAGFPETSIHADMDVKKGCIILEIKEGPRYKAGEIRVHNALSIPVDKLIKRLTSSHYAPDAIPQSFTQQNGEKIINWIDKNGESAKLQAPVWEPGKPVSFQGWSSAAANCYSGSLKLKPAGHIEEDITAALVELGYFFPKTEAWLELNPDTKTAMLNIKVLDQGPQAEIGSIDISGNNINSREDIFKYLGIKPGMAFTPEDCLHLKQKLWDSARFVKAEVTPINPASTDDKILLRINLEEYPHAPPLSKPFSPEEEVLLKLQEWLADSNRWNGDFTVKVGNDKGRIEFIQSPQEGTTLSFCTSYPLSDGNSETIDHRIILSVDELGFFGSATKSQFRANKMAGICAGFAFRLAEPYNPNQPHLFSFGFSLNKVDNKEDSPPFKLILNMQPAAFLSIAHEREASMSLHDGVLTIKACDKAQCWKIEAASGRLLSYTYEFITDASDQSGEKDSQQISKIEVQLLPGVYKKSFAEIHEESKNYTNYYNSNQPLGSFLAYLCQEPLVKYYLKNKSVDEKWLVIANKLVTFGALDPLDQWINQSTDKKTEVYDIPAKPGEPNVEFIWTNPNTWVFYGSLLNNEIFPRASWPWTLCQITILTGINKQELAREEWNRLAKSRDSGPLCFLAASLYAKYWRYGNSTVNYFAARGLERMSKEAFIKDGRAFFGEKHYSGKYLRHLVELFRSFSDEEIYFFAQNMDVTNQKYLAECDRLLRYDFDNPFDEVMPELLGALWDAGLRSEIESALIELRDCESAIR